MRLAFSDNQQGENKDDNERKRLIYAADYVKERYVRIAKMTVVSERRFVDMSPVKPTGSFGVNVQVDASRLH
jgi:hypothetical protein